MIDKKGGNASSFNISSRIELFNFLSTRTPRENELHGYTSAKGGKWRIPKKDLPNFLKLYQNAVRDGHILHITEKHRTNVTKFVLDLDLKYRKEFNKRMYLNCTIDKLIKIIISICKKWLKCDYRKHLINMTSNKKTILENMVFEKRRPTYDSVKKIYSDGIHIMNPYLEISPVGLELLTYEIREECKKQRVFNYLPVMFKREEMYDKIFDSNVAKGLSPWMLYGSCMPKNEGNNYRLTKIYDDKGKLLPKDKHKKRYDEYNLPTLLSLRTCKSQNMTPFDGYTKDVLLKKIHLHEFEMKDRQYKLKDKLKNGKDNVQDKGVQFILENIKKKRHTFNNDEEQTDKGKKKSSVTDVKKARQLVKLLNPVRADERDDWMKVGWALHNIDHSLLDDWIEFSKKSEKYVKGECDKLWKKFKSDGYTIGSLYMWAKHDDPIEYAKIRNSEVDAVLQQSVAGTNYQVARVLHEMYKHEFVCTSITHKEWYMFKNHGWQLDEQGYNLNKKLSTILINKYKVLVAELHKKRSETEDESEQDGYKKKADQVEKVIIKLNTTKFKTDVMTECRGLFFDSNFLTLMDEDRDKIRFENGVYNLKTFTFEEGNPEDYITKTTKIKYVEYDPKDEKTKRVKKLIEQIHTDDAKRNYLLRVLSSCLSGHAAEEKFHIWTGVGSNGKSVMGSLISKGFGQYYDTVSVALLTQKRKSSGSASPEVAKLKGVRIVFFHEPEEDDKINVGYMKQFTGGDEIDARKLYKEPVIFKPQCTPILPCNKLPVVSANDKGTWRRLRVLLFDSQFVESPDRKHKKEFLRINSLKEEIPELAEAFMSILVNEFSKYKKEGVIEPKDVTKYTDSYRQKSDIIMEFMKENYDETKKKTDKVSITMVYTTYRAWFKEAYAGNKGISKNDFKTYLENKEFKMKSGNLLGFVQKEDKLEDDIDDVEDK